MHLSFASLSVDPRGHPREPTGTQTYGTVLVFLFPRGGAELFSFGNDFAGPQLVTYLQYLCGAVRQAR